MSSLFSIVAIVFAACFSCCAFGSELAQVSFPRSSYTISYQNSDAISVKCKKDSSCVVTARVNGRSFKFSPEDLSVTSVNPYFASLKTPISAQSNREVSFQFIVSTSCPSSVKEKDLMCLTFVAVRNGKVDESSFESTAPYPDML